MSRISRPSFDPTQAYSKYEAYRNAHPDKDLPQVSQEQFRTLVKDADHVGPNDKGQGKLSQGELLDYLEKHPDMKPELKAINQALFSKQEAPQKEPRPAPPSEENVQQVRRGRGLVAV